MRQTLVLVLEQVRQLGTAHIKHVPFSALVENGLAQVEHNDVPGMQVAQGNEHGMHVTVELLFDRENPVLHLEQTLFYEQKAHPVIGQLTQAAPLYVGWRPFRQAEQTLFPEQRAQLWIGHETHCVPEALTLRPLLQFEHMLLNEHEIQLVIEHVRQ